MPPATRSPFADLLADLALALDRLGVGWYLFGAQAALLYGSARLTADVDVTVKLGEISTETLAEALRDAGFDLRIVDPTFVETTRVLPTVHVRTGIPADLVLAGPGIEDLFLGRCQLHDAGGVRVPVARPEDLVVMKVLAGRQKDRTDVIAILRAQGRDLDIDLVRKTIALLEQALDQSDLGPLFESWWKAAGGAR
jgi:hypothetical protein